MFTFYIPEAAACNIYLFIYLNKTKKKIDFLFFLVRFMKKEEKLKLNAKLITNLFSQSIQWRHKQQYRNTGIK